MQIKRMCLRPAQGIINLLRSIIDFIYPPICMICGDMSDFQPFVCNKCFNKIPKFDATPDSIRYHKGHSVKHVMALYYFDKVLQNIIHHIKYQDSDYMAVFLGKELGKYYKDHPISDCDALIPVPLHSARKRERSYNQSTCLARGIASVWGVDVIKNGLKRQRYTNTQTKLNKDERQKNIKDAFIVRRAECLPARVCIVDDVFTTGATTMEIARILKNAGVKEISILCLATPYHD